MVKIKTFTSELKIFHATNEIKKLDDTVNEFIAHSHVTKVISVSDVCTTDDSGATIGIIRVLAFE